MFHINLPVVRNSCTATTDCCECYSCSRTVSVVGGTLSSVELVEQGEQFFYFIENSYKLLSYETCFIWLFRYIRLTPNSMVKFLSRPRKQNVLLEASFKSFLYYFLWNNYKTTIEIDIMWESQMSIYYGSSGGRTYSGGLVISSVGTLFVPNPKNK